MCIHREKEFPALWEKIAAVGKFVQLRERLFSRREKVFSGLWKKVAAVGKFVQLRERLFSRREKVFSGLWKKVAAVGRFVRPPGAFILRKGECNTGNKGKRSSFSGPVLIVHLVLPCSFIS